MTYAVGAAAKTIIWISTEPREEHIEVFEWLNEVTPADMRWFLFKLEAIKIGESEASPLFTKVVGPSTEVKALGTEKKELADRHIKRLQFWEQLLNKLNNKTHVYKNVNPTKDNWIVGRTSISGVSFHIIIRMDSSSIQVVIDRNKENQINKKIFDYLYSNKEDIEKKFGKEIVWSRMDDQVSSRIRYNIEQCGLKDISTWETGQDKIVNEFIKWEATFMPYIKEIGNMKF